MSDLPVAQLASPYHPWPHRLAWLLVCATLGLLLVGAAVTGYGAGMSVPDWPTTYHYWFYPLRDWIRVWDLFLEHGHRLLAQLVGAITVALAAVLWKVDRRRAVRALVLAAVLGVIVQGTIGGLRVIADQRLLARVHGCIAPLFFTLAAALVPVTSRRWLTAPGALPSAAAGRLRRLLWALAAAFYAEIVLGTQLRVPSPVVGGSLGTCRSHAVQSRDVQLHCAFGVAVHGCEAYVPQHLARRIGGAAVHGLGKSLVNGRQ